ncbi:MAG: ATP-binding protein [Bacteroidota bacterium]|nr:MAG: ATP-binding protein [Bacteroidota bacterium]
MKEISMHILDLVQNSIQAQANNIGIEINENQGDDSFVLSITDNGQGMDEITLSRIMDPFFTTKNKKTGLGIPLLRQHTELTGGRVEIESKPGIGTRITGIFGYSHLDRQPLGDIIGTITGLIRSYPQLDFEYTHRLNQQHFDLSTFEIKKELEGISIANGEVIEFIKEMISENLKALQTSHK